MADASYDSAAFCAAVPPLEVNGEDDIAIGWGVDGVNRALRAFGRVLHFMHLEWDVARRSEGLGGTHEGDDDEGRGDGFVTYQM